MRGASLCQSETPVIREHTTHSLTHSHESMASFSREGRAARVPQAKLLLVYVCLRAVAPVKRALEYAKRALEYVKRALEYAAQAKPLLRRRLVTLVGGASRPSRCV